MIRDIAWQDAKRFPHSNMVRENFGRAICFREDHNFLMTCGAHWLQSLMTRTTCQSTTQSAKARRGLR